jgi:deglycase
MKDIREMKVAFIIAPKDFRDEEYFQPKVILQAKGIAVSTIAKGDPVEVSGTRGGKAHIDGSFKDLTPQNYDGIIFVGGEGAKKYIDDKKIHKIINQFIEADKVVGAICIAPLILANSGVLKGKKATAFSENEKDIKKAKAKFVKKSVVIDDKIVTASGAEAAIAFGEAVIKALVK